MSGYFYRLIQQTGIPLAMGQVISGGKFQDAIAPQIGSEFVPTQVEETQEIQKQAIQEEEFKQSRKVDSENIIESQLLNHKIAKQEKISPIFPVKTTAPLPIIKEQSAISQEQELESLSAQVTPSQNAIAAEKSPILPSFDDRENSNRTLENRRDRAVSETAGAVLLSPKKLPEPALSKHLQQGNFPEGSPTANSPLPDRQTKEIPQEPNLPATRQFNLQTVLEWVAETPAENPNYQLPIPNYQLPISNFQTQKTPNFALSIGTISLTVEAPSSEVKKPPLPPVKSQQEVKSINQNSRLSRHYIR